jgi:hypothetical protein
VTGLPAATSAAGSFQVLLHESQNGHGCHGFADRSRLEARFGGHGRAADGCYAKAPSPFDDAVMQDGDAGWDCVWMGWLRERLMVKHRMAAIVRRSKAECIERLQAKAA